ncbi:hypothetical protein MOV76_32175 [Rhizobium sp. PRIMUS64]|uniref:hypothetical protein n=1 Tax=Rhizobium sp. PRIMUS64 TaxID=2908925 RepID=UPI001FF3A4EA|nr:hypothetical protein [Rhizobium sp. PRIMUS64]MCJ9696230.1 hypothetical protein [Rhizobium sp. PRIMUS64]
MSDPRFDVLASLHFTWEGDDLGASVLHHIAIARAPSPTKDALSLGWLEGELVADGHSLKGDLRLTDLGRQKLLEFRQGWTPL